MAPRLFIWGLSISRAPLQASAGNLLAVCGVVVSAKFEANAPDQPTLLDLREPSPHAIFTAVIYGDNRSKFGIPETS